MSKFAGAIVNIAAVAIGHIVGGPWGMALAAVIMVGSNLLLAPKPKARTSDGQQVKLGEVPREGIFGTGATAGSLVDAFNYGGKHGTDWTVMCFALADHECEGLTGFYVKEKYVEFTGNGLVTGYKDQLRVHWLPGAWDDEVPDWVLANCPVVDGVPTWTADDRGRSVAKVWVAYKADSEKAKKPVWSGSPPSFLWVVKGLKCYSARHDDTVGGSGDHRWDDATTREWSENLIDCRYTWQRGIYAGGQVGNPAMLLLGRGLSAEEAPPSHVFAPANLCDENVPLAGGGTEKRYRIGGTFGGADAYIDTEEDFMAACGGWLVERDGSIDLVPGAAQPVVWDITDDDLVIGSNVRAKDFRSETDSEWVNSVAPTYIEPTQKWADHSAPVRRDSADIIADGKPRVASPSLKLVTSGTQAQRVAEMQRRMGRLWKTREMTLPPRLIGVQHGDWIRLTSRRYGPRPVTDPPTPILMRVESDAQEANWWNAVTLREVASDYADWTIADEIEDTSVAVDNPDVDYSEAPDVSEWALAAGAGDAPTLIFTGAVDGEAVTAIHFDYAATGSAPDADDDAAWISGGSAGVGATEFVISGVAPATDHYGAVSYQIGTERTDRLVLGPVTTTSDVIIPPFELTATPTDSDSVEIRYRQPRTLLLDYSHVLADETAVIGSAAQVGADQYGAGGDVVTITEDSIVAGPRSYWAVAYDDDGNDAAVGPVSINVGGFDFSGGVLPAGASLTRSGTGWYFNSSGVLTSAATDTARFDHRWNGAAWVLAGLLVEPSRENRIRNSAAAGSTAGVMTSGGVAPTNWTFSGSATGLTREIIGTGTEDGLNYIDIRIHGTATNAGLVDFTFEAANQSAAVVSNQFATSIFAKLIAGSLAGLDSIKIGMIEYNSSLTLLATQLGTAITPTATRQRFENTFVVGQATAAYTRMMLRIDTTVSVACDLTLRVYQPQFELGSGATSLIPTSGAKVTRNADALVLDWATNRHVPDGAMTTRYGFDDASTQDVATTVASGTATVPTTLNRHAILSAQKIS